MAAAVAATEAATALPEKLRTWVSELAMEAAMTMTIRSLTEMATTQRVTMEVATKVTIFVVLADGRNKGQGTRHASRYIGRG